MRVLFCVLLLGCQLLAQSVTREPSDEKGSFFVDGIVYQFAATSNCIIVAAAHAAINHKFLAVKVRVYNLGQRSISVRPEDVMVEDAIGGREVSAVSAAELARRMRKPYNMARYAVNAAGGAPPDGTPMTSDMVSWMAMMKAMAAHANGAAAAGNNLLYTDTPGALEDDGASGPAECDRVCRLHNREAQGSDPLMLLQRQPSTDSVEQYAFLANTISPHASAGGLLYFPLGKLSEAPAAEHGKKARMVHVCVSVPVIGERFQFELPVE